MNKFCGVGRVATDISVSYTANGTCCAKFNLAINRPKRQGQEKADADFLPVTVWGKAAEACGNFIGKGSLISVEGRVQTRSWEAQDGQKRKAVEINAEKVDFLDRRNQNGQQGGHQQDNGTDWGINKGGHQADGFGFGPSIPEEDVPF